MDNDSTNNTVPIIIDDIKESENIKFTRCMYFTIESDIPMPGWQLNFQGYSIPFFMLGLKGIVVGPLLSLDSENPMIFQSQDDFENLYLIVEAEDQFYISSDEIWVPNTMFKNSQKEGTLYRIGIKLFQDCYKYTQGDISYNQLVEMYNNTDGKVLISEIESKSFKSWGEKVIADSKNSDRNTWEEYESEV